MNVSNAMPMKHELIQQVIGTFVYQSNSDIRNNRNNYLDICDAASIRYIVTDIITIQTVFSAHQFVPCQVQ